MKSKTLIPALILGVFLTSCGPDYESSWQSLPLRVAKPADQGFSEEKLKEIDRLLQSHVDGGNVAGAIALVARRGVIVYYQAIGYDDLEQKTPLKKDAIFRIASQTKAVTSVAVMRLYEAGKFGLEDPISRYLPEFNYPVLIDEFNPVDSSYTTRDAKRAITIKDLLTHTSGYCYPGSGGEAGSAIYAKADIMQGVPSHSSTLKDEMQKIAKLPLIHEPGEKFSYGLSTDILGYLVEVVSGKSLAEYFETEIFEPLWMQDTQFYIPEVKQARLMKLYRDDPRGDGLKQVTGPAADYPKMEGIYYSGGGGLSSKPMDYVIFIQMLLNQGVYKETRILKPETIRMMRSNHIGELGAGSLFLPASLDKFGLGFEVIYPSPADSTLISEGSFGWGGAFGSLYWIDPHKEMIVHLVLQKAGEYNALRHEFVNAVYRAMEE